LLNQHKLENVESNLLQNYSRYYTEFVSGNGTKLYDTDGKEYIDFLSGIAVTGFGHNHPMIKEAVQKQIDNLWHVSNLFTSSPQEALAAKIAKASGLDKVFFCNSGTEANEAAIKFARKWGKGRSTILTTLGSFHGRTMGSLAASGQYKLWEGFYPLLPGFRYIPFGDLEALKYSYIPDLVAVMVEPIQGENGIIMPEEGYLKELRKFCDKHNLLLIIDEVQSGMGRTGKRFAYQWDDIKPDIITMAKGIANGLPLGAVACTEDVAQYITPGSHGSTFGGNPVSVAAANVVFDLLTDEKLIFIQNIGNYFKKELNSITEKIKTIRGRGLMIGIEFNEVISAKSIAYSLLEEGIVVGTSGDSILRILPPYIITEEEINIFIKKLTEVLNNNF
jgi:predicted acetylornithine/succinylornithine family transaminase